MNNEFEKYVNKESIGEMRSEIVYAICTGELSGDKLKRFINELESKKQLNNASIKKISSDKWDEKYLKHLKKEVIGGTFSREYLEYMSEVYQYIYIKNKKSRNKWLIIGAVGIAVAILLIAIIGIANESKENGTQKAIANKAHDDLLFAVIERNENNDENDSRETNK